MSSNTNIASGLCPFCGEEFEGSCRCFSNPDAAIELQANAREALGAEVRAEPTPLTPDRVAALAAWDAACAAWAAALRAVERGPIAGRWAAERAATATALRHIDAAEAEVRASGLIIADPGRLPAGIHPTLREGQFVREDGQCFYWLRRPLAGRSWVLAPAGRMEGAGPLIPEAALAVIEIVIITDGGDASARARIRWGDAKEQAAFVAAL